MIIDLHTHTSYGSPDSYVEPGDLVQRAKLLGLDGICFTEHNQLWDPKSIERLSVKHDFLILGGVELTVDDGAQVLIFGLHQPTPWVSIYQIEQLRQVVDEMGGVIIFAHPFRGESPQFYSNCHPGMPEFEAVCQNPIFKFVDAIETCNGHGGASQRNFSTKVANHLNLTATGGSDAHAAPELGTCFTVFENNVRNEQDLIAEIKLRRCKGSSRADVKLKSMNTPYRY